ncbi:MAG: DUF2505 domain-containing protein [Bradymonadales bacterium]|jgi:hypothetical protein
MATKLYIEDRFDCSAEYLYELMSGQELDDALMAELGIEKETLEHDERDEGPRYVLRLRMPDEIPVLFRKFIGERLSYVETRTWDAESTSNTWDIAPEISVKGVEVKGSIRIVDDGAGCKRITEGLLSVGIPLVGKKIEESLLSSISETFKKNAEFFQRHIAEKPEA